jgi:PAS domain S-box-containing protein
MAETNPKPAVPAEVVAHVADVLDALQCGALLLDRAGHIVHANPRLCEMLARPVQTLLGHTLPEFYPAAGEATQQFIYDFSAVRETEYFLPLPDGRRRPVLIAGRPPRSDSLLADYRVVTVIDITKLKDVEQSCLEQYRQIANLSDTVLQQALDLEHHSKFLEKRVRQRTRELAEANMEAIYMLAVACEAKDMDTGAHVLRIRAYSTALARAIGLPEEEAERIGYSAILHDVGKMQVPDRILKKPGPLTPEERREMEIHTVVGEHILSRKPFFDVARQIARSHQENWDGTGYPDHLVGDAIPLPARIVRLADVFDALASQRVYKPPWPPAEAVQAIKDGARQLFDPQLVAVFLRLVDSGEWSAIRGQHEDDDDAPSTVA